MPTRRLWRRSHHAGRGPLWGWAPKADTPKEAIGVEDRGGRSRMCRSGRPGEDITDDNNNYANVKKARGFPTLAEAVPPDGEEPTAPPCLHPGQKQETTAYRLALSEVCSEAAHLKGRITELEINCERKQNQVAQVQAAKAALEDRLKRETEKTKALETENTALRERVNYLLLQLREAANTSGAPAAHLAALSRLLPRGAEAGSVNFGEMIERWQPGLLREIHMKRLSGACACEQELAANGLSKGLQRFEDLRLLGRGSFGVVHAGVCTVSKKRVAIKTVLPGSNPAFVLRELMAYAILGKHENIIGVSCLSDFVGSQGLVMEAALCDLRSAVVGASKVIFSLAQVISFEADATAGLEYMHERGMVHVDHKLENTLVCTNPDSPWGFVGKVADPGLCCGIGEVKRARMGTISHAPPEALDAQVPASPRDDTFAVGVDLSFMLANPVLWREGDNLWAHWTLQTPDEKEALAYLQSEGGDAYEFMVGVTRRTMTDGTFGRLMLQPLNLNTGLPPTELENVCAFIRNAVSATPADRQPMGAVTAFLRALALSTAARWAEPSITRRVAHGHEGVVAEGAPALHGEGLEEESGENLVQPAYLPTFEGGGGGAEAGVGEEEVTVLGILARGFASEVDSAAAHVAVNSRPEMSRADAPTVPMVLAPPPEEIDSVTVAVSSGREIGTVMEILARGFVSVAGILGAPEAMNAHLEVSSGGAATEVGDSGGPTALGILARGFASDEETPAAHVAVNSRPPEEFDDVAARVFSGGEAVTVLDILARGFSTGDDTFAAPSL